MQKVRIDEFAIQQKSFSNLLEIEKKTIHEDRPIDHSAIGTAGRHGPLMLRSLQNCCECNRSDWP
jgi:hypothetical protein